MQNVVLGVDVGAHSIGWALLDRSEPAEPRIVACGVRIFPDPIDAPLPEWHRRRFTALIESVAEFSRRNWQWVIATVISVIALMK